MPWSPVQTVLQRLDPERAHALALLGLRTLGLVERRGPAEDARLAIRFCGRVLSNPIGLAAGFDKDAVALRGLATLGFGFVEAGTVTPLAQPGNPRPRLFRLTEDRAVINRMGFNNAGIARFERRLRAAPAGLTVGANLGLNRAGAQAERDYPALVAAVAGHAAYVALNVSSPNTPGLRDLQAPDRLAGILAAVRAAVPHAPPLFVKLSPDLDDAALPDILAACCHGGAAGLIVANTTLDRPPGLRSRHGSQAGGLSGAPLREPATRQLRRVAELTRGRLTLVGVGGIASGSDALQRLRAGASAIQLYSALALSGTSLIARIKRELLHELDRAGLPDVTAAIGADL